MPAGDESKLIRSKLIRTDEQIVTDDALAAELREKYSRLDALFAESGLDALLLRRSENIAWATAGQAEVRVLIPGETGVASLLITRDGRKFYLTTKNEAPRLAAEEFANLDYEPVLFPWYEDRAVAEARRLAGGTGKIGTDSATANFDVVGLGGLRASLTRAEISRYRWLGARTAAATSKVLTQLEPVVTEFEMEGMVSDALLSEGILPSVLLMAVDERIFRYKHAVARGASLKKYGMLNLCTRKWGLAISITRFVHFGAVPDGLLAGFAGAAEVNAALLHATQVGATSGELFSVAKAAYQTAGSGGEEELHHQGGACGYGEREWLATPRGTNVVVNAQGFAWNPSLRGAKVEDTVLLLDGQIECLTATPDLPVVETQVGAKSYRSAGVLVQD
ncbi:MAG TPA: aminopeptidase P family N-terminal domain-containing protein [Acidisarcina sp.]